MMFLDHSLVLHVSVTVKVATVLVVLGTLVYATSMYGRARTVAARGGALWLTVCVCALAASTVVGVAARMT